MNESDKLSFDANRRYFEVMIPAEQGLRELLANIFEVKATDIVFDVDPASAKNGIFKLRLSDNGPGMNYKQSHAYITRMGNSSKADSNFGQGARKANVARNPLGMVYETVQNGELTRVVLQKRKDNNYYYSIDDPVPTRRANGTTVTLLGSKKNQDTRNIFGMTPDQFIPFINKRFFDIEPVKVKVMNSRRETVSGLRPILESMSEESGTVALADGVKLRFYIFKDVSPRAGLYVTLKDTCFTEVYETRDSVELRNFGVSAARRRVAFVLEFSSEYTKAILDRTGLTYKGQLVHDWLNTEGFRRLMKDNVPKAILALEKQEVEQQLAPNEKEFNKAFKELLRLYTAKGMNHRNKRKKRDDDEEPRTKTTVSKDEKEEKEEKDEEKEKEKNGTNKKANGNGVYNVAPRFLNAPATQENWAEFDTNNNTVSINWKYPLSTTNEAQVKDKVDPDHHGAVVSEYRLAAKLALCEHILAVKEAKLDGLLTPDYLTAALLSKSKMYSRVHAKVRSLKKLVTAE